MELVHGGVTVSQIKRLGKVSKHVHNGNHTVDVPWREEQMSCIGPFE